MMPNRFVHVNDEVIMVHHPLGVNHGQTLLESLQKVRQSGDRTLFVANMVFIFSTTSILDITYAWVN
jgi:hypothetical protein